MSRVDGVRVSTMSNHVIVMGYSFLGKYVAEKLKDMGMEYVVVAKDEEQVEIARNNGITAMSSPINLVYDALKKVGIERASSLVATYDDDGDNMLSIMVAKQLNPKIRAITIINERELREGAKAARGRGHRAFRHHREHSGDRNRFQRNRGGVFAGPVRREKHRGIYHHQRRIE